MGLIKAWVSALCQPQEYAWMVSFEVERCSAYSAAHRRCRPSEYAVSERRECGHQPPLGPRMSESALSSNDCNWHRPRTTVPGRFYAYAKVCFPSMQRNDPEPAPDSRRSTGINDPKRNLTSSGTGHWCCSPFAALPDRRKKRMMSAFGDRAVSKRAYGPVPGRSIRDDDLRRTPGALAGRQDRRRLGLGPVETHGHEDRAGRRRQPVGLLVLARRVLLDVDRQ